MEFYELTYILEDAEKEKLTALAKRFQKINGWTEKEILQFAVSATYKDDIQRKLEFLAKKLLSLEKEIN